MQVNDLCPTSSLARRRIWTMRRSAMLRVPAGRGGDPESSFIILAFKSSPHGHGGKFTFFLIQLIPTWWLLPCSCCPWGRLPRPSRVQVLTGHWMPSSALCRELTWRAGVAALHLAPRPLTDPPITITNHRPGDGTVARRWTRCSTRSPAWAALVGPTRPNMRTPSMAAAST